MDPLEVEIAGLQGLGKGDLKIAWRRVFDSEPPARLTRDLMARAVAHRMQERAHGGLAPATRRRLRALAQQSETKGTDALDPGVALRPGTRWSGPRFFRVRQRASRRAAAAESRDE
jgi:hypothetical protein